MPADMDSLLEAPATLMPPLISERPLTRAERDRVERLLTRAGSRIGSFEALDGLFAALLSGPDLVMPNEFFPDILGDNTGVSPFKSFKEVQGILDLLMRHWNAVATALREQDPFRPALAAGGEPATAGRDWARGYQRGVQARAKSWRALQKHPQQGQYLRSILALAGDAPRSPQMTLEMQQRTGHSPMREIDLAALGANVTQVYRQLEARRHPAGPTRGPGARSTRSDRPRPSVPADAGPADRWEVGLIPIPGVIENDSTARPVGVVVADGEGQVVHLEVEGHPPADEPALATLVARGVVTAIGKLPPPPVVWVRDATLAAALQQTRELAGTRVERHDELPMIDDVARGLAEEFGGPGLAPSVAHSESWRGWGLANATIAALFAAAARYYRAAPWTRFDDYPPVLIDWPAGETWAASILGAAGEELGLALFQMPGDLDTLVEADGDTAGMAAFEGVMLSVVFSPQADLSRAMRKEVLANGWEVAGPEAYPQLIVANSPTAGITERLAARVTTALDALVQLAAAASAPARGTGRKRRQGIAWTDPETGVTAHYG